MNRTLRSIIPILFILTACLLMAQQQEIEFSSDYTRAQIREGNKSLLLSGNAWIRTENTQISSDQIELYGTDSRFVSCEGNVLVEDEQQQITLTSDTLLYDRRDEKVTISGWAEMEDRKNGIIARGGYLENSSQSLITKIQIQVRIFKDTDEGAMTCLSDSALYDSQTMRLELNGNCSVYWKSSSYHAARITIDLESNEISLAGNVRGSINE